MNKEKLYAIKTNRRSVFFVLAFNEREAENEAYDQIYSFTSLTEWQAVEMDTFLKNEDSMPQDYWKARAREYVVDDILFEVEWAIAEKYGDGEEAMEVFKRADDYITKHFPDLEAPYMYDIYETAKEYLLGMGEKECADIVQESIDKG